MHPDPNNSTGTAPADQLFYPKPLDLGDPVTEVLPLREAQILIEPWRIHYNTVRPHIALGYRPPAPETIVPVDQRPTMH